MKVNNVNLNRRELRLKRVRENNGSFYPFAFLFDLAAGVVRFHRSDVVEKFQVELFDQFVERAGAHVGADFAHDQVDCGGGMLPILGDG